MPKETGQQISVRENKYEKNYDDDDDYGNDDDRQRKDQWQIKALDITFGRMTR